MKRISGPYVIALALLLSACASSATIDRQINDVSPAEAALIIEQNSRTDDFVILDIRTPEEYAAGKIEGSVNVDFYAADFRLQLDALAKEARYLVYCKSGNRSGRSLAIFEDLGFARVDHLTTGIAGWYDEGYPVVP
jgi:rhodanese-related sulfurtransferase